MTPEMVASLITGGKIQHRIPCNPQPYVHIVNNEIVYALNSSATQVAYLRAHSIIHICTKIRAGTHVFIKERYRFINSTNNPAKVPNTYQIEYSDGALSNNIILDNEINNVGKWRSAASLPEKYSRLRLYILGIRLQQFNSISTDEIIQEGMPMKDFKKYWKKSFRKFDFLLNPWMVVFSFKVVNIL